MALQMRCVCYAEHGILGSVPTDFGTEIEEDDRHEVDSHGDLTIVFRGSRDGACRSGAAAGPLPFP